MPTASAPIAAAVAGAGKADKANADQKVTQMSPEDLKICKDNQVCRIHATGGTCKFEGNCRWKHTTADERKKMGMSFSATSSKGEDQKESEGDAKTSLKPAAEEALINSLMDDVREITAAGPVANRGDTFHNKFSIGLFADTAGKFSRLTSSGRRSCDEY